MSEPPPDEKPEKIPRPPNAWIIFRAEMIKNWPVPLPGQPRYNQGELSTILGNRWRNIDNETRRHYERLAEEAKAAHRIKYPGYKYEPKKKADKELEKAQGKKAKSAAKAEKKVHRVGSSAPAAAAATPSQGLVYQHLLLPNAHYYVPAMDFSHGGPSPPLSAASSPRASSSPDLPSAESALDASASSSSASSSSSPFPGFPAPALPAPSPLPFPLLALPQSPASPKVTDDTQETQSLQLDAQVSPWNSFSDHLPVDNFESAGEDATVVTQSIWNDASSHDPNAVSSWNHTSLLAGIFHTIEPPHLTFSLSEASAAQLDTWLQNNGMPEVASEPDLNGFAFPVNFDLDPYNNDFGGELDVSIGHVHGLYETPNYVTEPYSNDIDPYGDQAQENDATLISDFLMDYTTYASGSESYPEASMSFHPPYPASYSDTPASSYDDLYNTPSMSTPATQSQPSPSSDTAANYALLQPVENSIQSLSSHSHPPYVPPTGAGNSNRRVAATYNKELFTAATATATQEVSAR